MYFFSNVCLCSLFSIAMSERMQGTADRLFPSRVGLEFDGRIVGQIWSKIRRNHLENLKTDSTLIETVKFDRLSNSIPVREYIFGEKKNNIGNWNLTFLIL